MIAPAAPADPDISSRTATLLSCLYQPVLERCGYALIVRQHVTRAGWLPLDTVRELREADLAIADLLTHDANVLYEIGVRHAFRRPTLLITDEGAAVPGNLEGLRVVRVNLSAWTGRDDAQRDLEDQIRQIERDPASFPNAITLYLRRRTDLPLDQVLRNWHPAVFNQLRQSVETAICKVRSHQPDEACGHLEFAQQLALELEQLFAPSAGVDEQRRPCPSCGHALGLHIGGACYHTDCFGERKICH